MGKGNGKSGDGNNTGKKLENLLGKIPRDDYPPEMLEKRRSAYQEQIRDINANIGEGGSDEGKSCWDAIFPSLLLLVTGLGLLSHYI